MSDKPSARERILAAAVRQIAQEGIDGVRIARIAMAAGVSTSLVHYHFDSRDALLAEALDYSYAHAGDARISTGELPVSSHAERLQSMIDQCLPTSEALQDDWVLWVELWLRAVRNPELRPIAEELYARLHAWFAEEIAAGIDSGEFAACDPDEVGDLVLALLDGYGIRTLIGDSAVSIERARRAVAAALAARLGLGEWLVADGSTQTGEPAPSAARAAARPVRTAPSM
jgi:AcrR family transcriptional regulator